MINQNDKNLVETKTRKQEIYDGKIIKVNVYDVDLPNGSTSKREVVYHQGAVAVIAVHEGYMYFVKQYRISPEEILLEVPAGKIEPEDSPKKTAFKELKEETGLTSKSVKKLYEFYVSPGFSDEKIYLYEAQKLTAQDQQLDEDEFLELIKIKLSDLNSLVEKGYIRDAKTLIAVQHVLNSNDYK